MGDAGRDTRLHPISAPWLGVKGPSFTITFEPEFTAGLAKVKDKFASLKQHLHGKDPGARPPVTAAQLAANPNHVSPARAHAGVAAEVRDSTAAWRCGATSS